MTRTRMRAAPVAVGAMVLVVGCGSQGTPSATQSTAPPLAPIAENPYASLARLPDWSGVWEPTFSPRPRARQGGPAPPKLTAAYAAQYAKFQQKNRTTPGINFVSDVASCVPPGVPQSMQEPYPIEFLFTPGRVTILIETYSLVRRIYTDGRPAPADPDPTYQGTSVGHWEGDTLVVETSAILPETSPLNGINGHSDKFHVTERMRLVKPDLLEVTTTRVDPAVFVEPYTTSSYYRRHRDWQIMEYVCQQNNHDALDAQGKPAFSLKHNPGE
ncbi:MAG TPA: hypothetical protein VMD49_00265 [Steroidobacteraceae bacterium]|nr:hypothetical protein [Steroidobacteraceae bacterium]